MGRTDAFIDGNQVAIPWNNWEKSSAKHEAAWHGFATFPRLDFTEFCNESRQEAPGWSSLGS